MKKKILSLIFVLCLIIPAVLMLSACNDERLATEKDVQVYAEYEEDQYGEQVLKRIVLKVSVGKTTVYLYGGGGFYVERLNGDNSVLDYYTNLLCNYKYSFVVPENVKKISDDAFSHTSLTDIEINRLSELGGNPFKYCKELESINIIDDYSEYDTRNNCNAIIKGNELVVGCKTTVIPSTVTSIGDNDFYGSSITTLNVPGVISSIGSKAFYDSSISDITLPNTITSIGSQAFARCEELKSIQLPSSLTVLEYGIFQYSGLTSLNISDTIEEIKSGVLIGCPDFETLNIGDYTGDFAPSSVLGSSRPNSILVDEDNTRYTDHNNSNVIVEKSTNTLILGCKNSILDDSIEIIGNSAFAHSSGLTTITLPSNLVSIGAGAFYDTDLYEVVFNDKLTHIGSEAFYKTKLKNINLTKVDLTIGDDAFSRINTFEYVVVSSEYNIRDIFSVSILPVVYYYGTPTEFSNKEDASYFTESIVNFYSENEPAGNASYYWHFDTDGKTPIAW